MNDNYDVVIIGSGPGGYVAAIRSAQLGLKTAIVEKESLGGVCLNWGCIPTKSLLKSAEVYQMLKHSDFYGIKADKVSIDFKKIIKRSRGVAKTLSDGISYLLKKNKIDLLIGSATFVTNNHLKVNNNGNIYDIKSDNIIIATGARAKLLPDVKLSKNIWTYREAMVPEELPKNIAIIGSGAIGMEFASFYNALGSNVSVIEIADNILPSEDKEVSEHAKKEFSDLGIKFYTQTSVQKISSKDSKEILKIKDKKNKINTIEVDKVIIAIGIIGNIDNLGLENIDIKTENGHIITDKWSNTNIKNIYAIGDVAGAPWLAHKASHEAVICVEKISGLENLHPLNKNNIPGCVYSTPQIASIGLTEKIASENYNIKVGKFPLMANGKAQAIGSTSGFVKVIYDEKTGELLGAHMIGDGVTELIHGYAIAKNMEGTEEDIKTTVFPHPTLSESLHEAVLNAYDISIHF
ncbi:MAG: dihydrolipoyl dehydrogenase [Rhodobiaceae bacterium]|jgi:dihydrolipoamide dehydrogenase|nr:dihydrolipoyl dehydrogenase [Rhodobiaceae bacterium]MDC3272951.1 dihydrolipoyl dehydrogenase [Hyphomicrobiales bacterium]|tara:strand:- start:237 stop:1628 length:1392 start_codon:yes stop_codon:yes gene_type:complete